MSTPDDRLLLGLDAGGSSTTAMLARLTAQGWAPLGRGTSGSGNPSVGDTAEALGHLDAAIADAFAQSGRIRQTVDSACLAVAGSDRESVRTTVQSWVGARAIADAYIIVHDAEPLLAWAGPQETAVALVSGTGSLAWGRNRAGQTARAGGWGPALGDEGSGHWFAIQALRAVLRAIDHRGDATRLAAQLALHLGLTDWKELPAHLQTLSVDEIASMAPLVSAASEQGDAVAVRLIAEASEHLAEIVTAVASQLGATESLDRLAISGGVLIRSPAVQQQVIQRIVQAGFLIHQVQLVDDPVQGSVELACRLVLH